jgi:hypothetical protein
MTAKNIKSSRPAFGPRLSILLILLQNGGVWQDLFSRRRQGIGGKGWKQAGSTGTQAATRMVRRQISPLRPARRASGRDDNEERMHKSELVSLARSLSLLQPVAHQDEEIS